MTDTKHPEALRLVEQYDYGDPVAHSNKWKAAACNELRRLHAENETLQQGYNVARLEIDHLRGVTKSKLLAQPVAWMVYLPSIDTQHLYYSQEDMGYVDDVTNHDDAEVTPLYEMAAPKASVTPSDAEIDAQWRESVEKHETTAAFVRDFARTVLAKWGAPQADSQPANVELFNPLEGGNLETELQMAAVIALRDSQPALPEITAEDRSFLHDNPNTDDIVKWVQHYASAAITADRAMRAQAAPVAQGDARADQALLKVLTAVQRYLPPDGPSAKDTLTEIIGIIDPWPLGDQKGKA